MTGDVQLSDQGLVANRAWVDGQWLKADSGATFAVTDPATGETIAQVPDMGAAETRRAIDAAERALPAWRKRTARDRGAILRRWLSDREPRRRSRDADDARAGQAPCRSAR